MKKGDDLKQRTKEYSIRIIRLVESLPNTITGRTIANQLIRSGTSVAANYRAVCRARSTADFIAKLGIVIEETDESAFWIELIIEKSWFTIEQIQPLLKETNEILAIMIASCNSAKKK